MTTEAKIRPWLMIALLAVIIIGGGFTYWYSYANKNKVATATSPTPTKSVAVSPSTITTNSLDATANWKTYTNTKYGYLIKFPTDFSAVVGGLTDSSEANPDSGSIIITNNKLAVDINPDVLSSGESEIKGIIVDKGLMELAQSAENSYSNQTPGSVEFVKFSYLKKSYSFAELAGYMEGIIDNTKKSEDYGKYIETYRLQTKHSGRFFEVNYSNRAPNADKNSIEFKAGIDKMEKIISTIEFTK